eukprot:1343605-Amorphochlora_amoeboformis.AAC.1
MSGARLLASSTSLGSSVMTYACVTPYSFCILRTRSTFETRGVTPSDVHACDDGVLLGFRPLDEIFDRFNSLLCLFIWAEDVSMTLGCDILTGEILTDLGFRGRLVMPNPKPVLSS